MPEGLDVFHAQYQDNSFFYIRREKKLEHTLYTKHRVRGEHVSISTGCIKMIGAVWKLIIFTSMVKRFINTSRNERVTLQVYDTCLQMFLFFGLQRKDRLTRSTVSSDTRCRPALFPLQRHPVVRNC